MRRKAVSLMVTLSLTATTMGMPVFAGETTFDENGISGRGQLPISEENIELDVFIVQLPQICDLNENQVTIQLQEETNVTLNLNMVPSDTAKEKLNMLLMSGEYPDVIIGQGIFSSTDMITYGTEEQILIPLNDLIDQYCVNIQERWDEMPGVKDEMTSPDGNIYGIPTIDSGGRGHTDVGNKMWINTEWLDAVGMEMPTTTDEFRAVLEAFRDKDPNGNGIQDEIPLTGAANTWAGDPYLFLLNSFGYYNGAYYMQEGEIKTVYDQDWMREGLEYIAGLYADGLIDPAAFTQDEAQMSVVGNNPDTIIAGAASCGHIGMFANINDVERASQYVCLMPLTGSNGYCGIPYNKKVSVSSATFAITDKCKHPEAAIKIADLFCGAEWSIRASIGIQGIEWDVADEGTVSMTGELASYKYLYFATDSSASQKVNSWNLTMRLMEPNWKALFAVEGDLRSPENYEAFLYNQTIAYEPYAADVDIIPDLKMDEETNAEFSNINTMVKDYVNQSIVEFITGKRSLENDWDEYLTDLDRLGYYTQIQMVVDALAAQE